MDIVFVFLANGFEETEAICPADLLKRAGLNVKTVSITDKNLVTGSRGITVVTDLHINEVRLDEARMFILPGGMPGAENLLRNGYMCELITDAVRRGIPVGAICAAPMILGELGLLRGKRATCFPGYENSLIGAEVCDDDTVTDGNFVTARCMGSSFAFGVAAIKLLLGAEVAEKTAMNANGGKKYN